MDGACLNDLAGLDQGALSLLLPMHVIADSQGTITHAGETILKLFPDGEIIGADLFGLFGFRRPCGIKTVADLAHVAGAKLHLSLGRKRRVSLKGVAVPLAGGGILINLSFGIAIVEAVAQFNLNASDFAPTDLAVEMLFLFEAKSAAMEASRRLNARLQSARIAAEEQAFTDTLTGLKNRRAADHVLERCIEGGRRFALMQIDLDYFKDVNDTLGHAAGDHVLQHVAQVLRDETRQEDLVARVGGDEFILLIGESTDERDLDSLARRIIRRLEEPILYKGRPCRISASIGTTVSDRYEQPQKEEMMRDADIALYASKHRGRACHTVFSADLPEQRSARPPSAGRRSSLQA